MANLLIESLKRQCEDSLAMAAHHQRIALAASDLLALLLDPVASLNLTVTAPVPEAAGPSTTPRLRNKLPNRVLSQLGKGQRYFGIINNTARKLRVSQASVRQVAQGEATSTRILLALVAAVAAVDAKGGKA